MIKKKYYLNKKSYENKTIDGDKIVLYHRLYKGHKNESIKNISFNDEHFDFFIPISSIPTLFLEDKMTFGEAGFVYMVQPYRKHGFLNCDKDIEFFALKVDSLYMRDFLKEFSQDEEFFFKSKFVLSPLAGDLLQDAFVASERKDTKMVGSILEALLRELAYSSIHSTVDARADFPINVTPVVRDVINYLYENYDKQIKIKEIAQMFDISIEHLIRLFKDEINDTPKQFMLRLRLNKARSLFENTNYKTHKISLLCGISSTNTLTEAFKKVYGISVKEIARPAMSETIDFRNHRH